MLMASPYPLWEAITPHKYVAGRNTRPRNAVIWIFYTFHWFKFIAQVAPQFNPQVRIRNEADESAFPHSAFKSVTNTEEYGGSTSLRE